MQPQQEAYAQHLRLGFERRISGNGNALWAERLRHYAGTAEHLDGAAWADKYRVMPESSVFDRWDTARTPYLYDIARAMSSNSPAQKFVIISKAAQMGLSEVILNDMLRRIHLEPAPMLHFMEKEEHSMEWQLDRLHPALRQPPFVGNKSIRLIGSSVLFPGGFVHCRSAGSANSLRGTTARVIYGDEVASYAESIGGEGDFLSLARQRVVTYADSAKVIMLSTPLDRMEAEGTFYSALLLGDCRVYEVPCKSCKKHQRWNMDSVVRYEERGQVKFGCKCEHCGHITEDGSDKDEAVREGRWTATREAQPGFTSFMISGLYAPADWRPLRELYAMHETARLGSTNLKAFYNTDLGEFFDEPDARAPLESEAALRMIKPQYNKGNVPNKVAFLTMSCDVQKDFVAWEVRGWAERFENFSIDRGRIECQIGNTKEVVQELRRLMAREWPRHDGKFMRIWFAGIDEGYKAAAVHQVMAQFPQPIIDVKVMRIPRGCVCATKGGSVSNAERLILGLPGGKTAKGQRRRLKFFRLGTDIAKRELYMAIKSPPDTDKEVFGIPHAPIEYDEEYYQELVAEKIVTERHSVTGRVRQVFKLPPRKANEALDLWVISRALAEIIGATDWLPDQWEHVRKVESRDSEIKSKPMHTKEHREAMKAARQEARAKALEKRRGR